VAATRARITRRWAQQHVNQVQAAIPSGAEPERGAAKVGVCQGTARTSPRRGSPRLTSSASLAYQVKRSLVPG
jgi:hypothetical protein